MDVIKTFFNVPIFTEALPALLKGLLLTLELGGCSVVVGTLLGLAVGLAGLYGPAPLRVVTRIYIDVLRSMPLLVFLVLIYYALPFVKILLPAFLSAVLAISMIASAYVAEIFRAGIEAVSRGQFEASRSLGLTQSQTLRFVILPQAVRLVLPPLTGNAVSIMKDTATASVVALPELLQQATSRQALAANPTPLIGAALIAERDALRLTSAAQAEKAASADRGFALRAQAEADADADKIKSMAMRVRAEIEAEAMRLMNEAHNMLTPEARMSALRMRLVEKAEGIIRESVRPMERIEGIKILQVDGFGGGGGGHANGDGGHNGSFSDGIVNSALRFRAQAPLVDQLLREIGIEGGDIQRLVGGVSGAQAALPPAPASAAAGKE